MTPVDLASTLQNRIPSPSDNDNPEPQSPPEITSVTSQSAQSEEFDTFLNLLTAQIRNQDPLAPLDSTQFVEQLATFSGLELQATNNQLLEDIAQMLADQLYTSDTPATES